VIDRVSICDLLARGIVSPLDRQGPDIAAQPLASCSAALAR